MKREILITGSEGCIGTILKESLRDYSPLLLDIKGGVGQDIYKIDIASDYMKLVKLFNGIHTVIHLAWNFFEDFPKETIFPDNKKMAENVYSAAVESGTKRVIIASSVHASDYSNTKSLKNFDIERSFPDSPYGASKVYIESLGMYYASHYDLEVVCIRFGGVNKDNAVIYEEDCNYNKVLLYKEDCAELVRMCIEADKVPNNFQVITAVSNNENRVHDTDNFLKWRPKFPIK